MIRIPLRYLRCTALATLLLPEILFLATWVRPVFSISCCLALVAAFFFYTLENGIKGLSDKNCIEFSPLALLTCLACAFLWTFLSGIGGFFYQNEDFYGRNAIFHDLLNNTWPVRFPGTNYALTYYVGFWILPALLGKLTAILFGGAILWTAANAFLFAETVWFLFLVFLLLLSLLQVCTAKNAFLLLLFFVLFSGMDGLGAYLVHWDWNQQIEWWAQLWQYSSNTTCLFWVFNQAVPAWLATLLLISNPIDVGSYALIGLSMLLYSPLSLTGFVFICIYLFLIHLIQAMRTGNSKKIIRTAFSVRNLLVIAGSLPILLYLSSNGSSTRGAFRFDLYLRTYSPLRSLFFLFRFYLIEWFCLAAIVAIRFRRDPLFWAACLSLCLASLFKVGYHMDFSMRASIPGLIILCVYCARFLQDTTFNCRFRISAAILVLFLFIGCQTPMQEFRRGVYKVKQAGTNRIFSDPYGTVLHPDADTDNFICRDTNQSFFYQVLARSPNQEGD